MCFYFFKLLFYFKNFPLPSLPLRADEAPIFRILTIVVFVAGYITARFSLITAAIDLGYSAWDLGIVVRSFSRGWRKLNPALFEATDMCVFMLD